MDNYNCEYIYHEGDITLKFLYNNKTVYSFLINFNVLYNKFISKFDKNKYPSRFEFLNSNGVSQIRHDKDYISFDVSRYDKDVYVDTTFTIKINPEFSKLVDDLKKFHDIVNSGFL